MPLVIQFKARNLYEGDVAELADALDSKSSVHCGRVGSIPTIAINLTFQKSFSFYEKGFFRFDKQIFMAYNFTNYSVLSPISGKIGWPTPLVKIFLSVAPDSVKMIRIL